MTVVSHLSALAPITEIGTMQHGALTTPLAPQSASASFGELVSSGLAQVDQQLQVVQSDMHALAAGEVGSLHTMMIRMEESRLGFQLLLQVRNRLLESYQELMRMQV